LRNYLGEVNAQMPRVNPNHDPSKPTASSKGKGEKDKNNKESRKPGKRKKDR